MRQFTNIVATAIFLTACGTAAASSRNASGPVVEDRSYDRIEALRAARFTSQADAWDRIEELRAAKVNGQADAWDRIEALRLQRSTSGLK
ncbi:MAG: hypothetical protein ABJB39_10115 [Chloroflexota bacterium]